MQTRNLPRVEVANTGAQWVTIIFEVFQAVNESELGQYSLYIMIASASLTRIQYS